MHHALVGLPDQSREEQQTKSEGPCAGAVDHSSVSQTWEVVSCEEIWLMFINLRNLQSAMFSF